MMLPQVETEKVMKLEQNVVWKDHAHEVRFVFNSSRLGQSLMAGAIVAVSEFDAESVIENALTEMGKSSCIDDTVVAKTLQSISESLQSVAGIQSLMGRRKPTFQYRGVSVVVPVQSLEHHFNTALAIRLRQEAALNKQILALLAEDDLCSVAGPSTWVIAESLILGAKKARKLLWDKINEQGKAKTEKKEKKEKDGNVVEA
eukprot:5077189-Amphidinium_carterae.3